MSLLSQIHVGKKPAPPRILLYGMAGVGKSTFGSQAPKPIFIQTEDGLGEIDCAKFPLAKSFADVLKALDELAREKHDYQTVVVDSVDWLERIIHDQICNECDVAFIEQACGGYGKAYTAALGYFRQVVNKLAILREQRQMVVLLIAHYKIEKFENPEGPSFDRYSPRLHKTATDLFCEWVDAVLFATCRMNTEDKTDNNTRPLAKPVGAAGGERILRCVGNPALIAKNHYGITADLPLSWSSFVSALSPKGA